MFAAEINSLNVQIDNCQERVHKLLETIKKAKEESWFMIEEYNNGLLTSHELCGLLLSTCKTVEDFATVAQLSVALLEETSAVSAIAAYEKIEHKRALKQLVKGF